MDKRSDKRVGSGRSVTKATVSIEDRDILTNTQERWVVYECIHRVLHHKDFNSSILTLFYLFKESMNKNNFLIV